MKIILFHDIISTYLCIDPRRLKRWAYHDRDDLILILPETCFSASPFPLKIDSHHENVSKLYIAVDGNSHINYREMLQNINKSSAGRELQLWQYKDGLCGRVRVRGRGPGQVCAWLCSGDQEAPRVAAELRRHHRQLLRGGLRADAEEESVSLHHHLLPAIRDVCHRFVFF